MAGTSSDIRIASNALQLFGHSAISSFNEATAGAEIASNLYETSYKFMLVEYRWRFATKKAKLARLADAPIDDYLYKFQIPPDSLYVIRPTIANLDYEIYEDTIHTNVTELTIDYIYNVPSDKLPHYYILALEHFLATRFVLPITGDLNKLNAMNTLYDSALKKAKFADATQRPPETFDDNPYIDVRYF